MAIIEVKNLSKTFDYYKKQPGFKASLKSLFKREKLFTEAVKNINLKIEEGELVGFLGPNGAGKTTTLKMLSGILYPTSGEITALGFTPHERKKEYQKQFALVMGQKNQLWWDLPSMDSFILNKEIYEVDDKIFEENLKELVELLDAKDILDIQVRKLSLGQRMKCELIAALLHKPKVLFLDEPTIGLDVIAQKNIRDFIKKYNREYKTTIILTSHYMDDIEELCERVVIIDRGVIGYDGKLSDLINKYATYKILQIRFNGSGVKKHEVDLYGEIDSFDQFNVVYKIGREKVKETAAKILSSNLPVDDILIGETDVEDVIREVFNKNIKKYEV